jgi:DnaK suppressor protein
MYNMSPMPPKKLVTLPEGYTPTDGEEYMNPYQLEYFRLKLLKWREDLGDESLATVKHLQENNWKEPDLNDQASVETEANLELRTRDRYRKLINKIDDALKRIEQGIYGYCEYTGEPIGIRRLEARPIATLSIEAQQRHERFEKSHSED